MAQLKTQIPALALFFLLNNLLVKQVISYPLLKTNGGNVDVMLPNDHLLKRQITTKAIKMGLKAAKRLILKYNVVLIILIVVVICIITWCRKKGKIMQSIIDFIDFILL
ncbi:11595_t:CDS:1 [Entrophospora sp. SA101]|nr:11595_t:CDS:1 [Entrophospora sp. SA101]